MRPWLPILVSLVLVSCDKGDTGMDYGILEGELILADGPTATVVAYKAFGVDRNGKALLYFTSSESATCAGVAEFLAWGEPTDPTALFSPGHCNVSAVLSVYDGSEVTINSGEFAVTWNLTCVLGDGAWNWEERGNDDGYYWSGRTWSGGPDTFTLTVSGGGGDDFVADVEMNDYSGNYIYESFDNVAASGLVSGTTLVEWCDDMSETPLLAR